MAWEIPGFQLSILAGGTAGQANSDLSVAATVNSISVPNGYQYMFVKQSGGVLVPIAAATDIAVGVLQNKPAPGQAGTVMVSGVTRVRSSSSSISVGTLCYIDAYGMVTATHASNNPVGISQEVSATATGYVIALALIPYGAAG